MAMSLPSGLDGLLAPFCFPQSGPGSGPFPGVNLQGIQVLASHLGITPIEAMLRCLEHDVWPLRFARNRGVFTAAEQRRLLESRAAVIGCGGLGGHVATLLAKAGVGAFSLCDFDVFDESNLNRQLLCTEASLGRNKAEVAKKALHSTASHTDIRIFPVKAEPGNLPEILRDADIVMDCLDSLEARKHVARAASEADIPFIYGAVAGDEGFAMAALPGEDSLRSLLESAPASGKNGAGKGAELHLGVPTLIPAAIAALQANLAIRLLVGKPLDAACLYHFDLSAMVLESLGFGLRNER